MILMCEDFRTRDGFELLIKTNFINLGFQFNKHNGLTMSSSKHQTVCPLFLMFLDCVHQLCHQFPATFQFLPRYLIHVWDTCLLPVTQTFMFDCEQDREVANRNQARGVPSPASAFDWLLQYQPQQIADWDNPLFGIPLRPSRKHDKEELSYGSMIMGKVQSPLLPLTSRYN